MGYDFFEVTFLYNDNGNYKIAKAAWELGEPAGVSDVYRDGGVDYYGDTDATRVGIPPSGQGSAVLFVGRKSDKTLLAVGTLSHIDGISVTDPSNPLITPTTKKVSFAVNALKAGVSSNYSSSSFKITSHPQEETLKSISIGDNSFPYFHLPVDATATATYKIDVHSSTTPGHPYSFYAPAIIFAGGASYWNVKPHYTLPPDVVKDAADYKHQTGVIINITSPLENEAGSQFSGTVGFSIYTALMDKMIFSLTFRIPVYAVYSTPESVQWNIKPGYNLYYDELDNGAYENGGAVLIGIGNIEGDLSKGLIQMGEPIKYNINSSNTDPISKYFNLTGFEYYFRTGNGGLQNLTPVGGTTPPSGTYPNYWGWAGVTFYYDHNGDDIADQPMPIPGTTFMLPAGRIKIRIEYITGTETYYDSFYVEVNDLSSTIEIPYENRYIIAKPSDWVTALNGISSGNYLFVFVNNINLPDHDRTLSANATIFMAAAVPNIVIGRANGTDNVTFNGNGSGNWTIDIYFGKWPFNEPVFAGGDVITNEDFQVSSRGTWGNYAASGGANSYMFEVGNNLGTGTVNVHVLAGMKDKISYKNYLGVNVFE